MVNRLGWVVSSNGLQILLILTLSAAALTLTGEAAAAQAGSPPGSAAGSGATKWRLVYRDSGHGLSFVTADSRTSAWAADCCDGGYLVHWNGTGWRRQRLPQTINIESLSATSPGNLWVFGQLRGGQRVALRWDGHRWYTMAVPDTVGLWQAVVSGSSNVWTLDSVGTTATGPQTTISHWNGSVWSTETLPGTASQIAGTSERNLWRHLP